MLGVAAARLRAVYGFLWRYVPGFRYQRIPERATVLVGIAAPSWLPLASKARGGLLRRWRTAGVLVFSLGLAAFLYESWSIDAGHAADGRPARRT